MHLVGRSVLVDTATGEALLRSRSGGADGRLMTACGNRRATVCPTCSRVYRADTYQLIRAGLTVGRTCRKKWTRTRGCSPPSRLRVRPGPHSPRAGRSASGLPSSPDGEECAARGLVGCHLRHAEHDPQLGEPLCARCYDYAGAVLWQAQAGELWHRFTLELRREVARRVGLSRTDFGNSARLSYAKVAEYQRRAWSTSMP